MFAASAPLSAGDAAQVGQQIAAIMGDAGGDAADRGAMAAALTAAQAVMCAVPVPAKAATPKQAADQALQRAQAYVATYDAWLAVLMRHPAPAPCAAAMPRGAKACCPCPGLVRRHDRTPPCTASRRPGPRRQSADPKT